MAYVGLGFHQLEIQPLQTRVGLVRCGAGDCRCVRELEEMPVFLLGISNEQTVWGLP